LIGVAPRTAVQSDQLQRASNNGWRRIPIFEIEENQSLAKQLGFMFGFNFQSPRHMLGTDSIYQVLQRRCRHSLNIRLEPSHDYILLRVRL
jgi:hypothetical protein